jgi:hypothetical protein
MRFPDREMLPPEQLQLLFHILAAHLRDMLASVDAAWKPATTAEEKR